MDSDRAGASSRMPPDDAFGDAAGRLRQLKDYAAYYLSVRADALKLRGRHLAILGALGALGALIGAAALVTATVLLCIGIAGALGALLGGRVWLGYLVFGVLVLLLVTAVLWFGLRWFNARSRKATVDKYEKWKKRQRKSHEQDARQEAANR